MSNLSCAISSILLPQADKRCTPVHGCIISVMHNFPAQALLITDLEGTVSQNVETLFVYSGLKISCLSVMYVNLYYCPEVF